MAASVCACASARRPFPPATGARALKTRHRFAKSAGDANCGSWDTRHAQYFCHASATSCSPYSSTSGLMCFPISPPFGFPSATFQTSQNLPDHESGVVRTAAAPAAETFPLLGGD